MRTRAPVIILGSVLLAAVVVAVWYATYSKPAGADIHLQIRAFALNLDPQTLADTESRKVATLLYTGLVAVDQDGAVLPRVAKSWKRRDARTWEFKLGKDETFSDGTPVTPAKVISSLCASMQPSDVQSWSLASIERKSNGAGHPIACTGLIAEGEDTVLIRETVPTPWLFEALAGPGGWIVDIDPSKKAAYGVRPGTGPYVISSIVADQRIVLDRRKGGTAVPGKVNQIEFDYAPDPSVATRMFETGQSDLIEIDSPQIAQVLLAPNGAIKRADSRLIRYNLDRVRVVMFNLKRLQSAGLSDPEIRSFLRLYSEAAPRQQIAANSNGLLRAMESAFPPFGGHIQLPADQGAPRTFPKKSLTLITENDSYSDHIAAGLPQQIGNIHIAYQAMEKSLLIGALLKGNFDAVLMKLEATHHTPTFWTAFFTPGNPYTAFGYPIDGIGAIDLSQPSGIGQAASLIDARGNWIGIAREVGLYASTAQISGVRLTGSGQLSFETIGKSR